mgnify:CR=1 FL=1
MVPQDVAKMSGVARGIRAGYCSRRAQIGGELGSIGYFSLSVLAWMIFTTHNPSQLQKRKNPITGASKVILRSDLAWTFTRARYWWYESGNPKVTHQTHLL